MEETKACAANGFFVKDAANITIDATRTRPISPYIYGVNFPDWKALGFTPPLARQGGNRMSAYNWENNASNAGSDWHHQNDGYLDASDEPGKVGRLFVEGAVKNGAAAILTVPMTGYVAADKKGDGDVNQSPDYLKTRFKRSLPRKPGRRTFPPDTRDEAVYQDEFVAWIESKKGRSPLWYALDNEPDLWAGTHARLWPKTPTYAQIVARSIEYAAAIKDVAPKALVLGPVNYGWQGFRRFQDAADAGDREFLDVYLAAMRDAGKKAGRRLLDLLDIHFYPEAQGGGVRVTEESKNPATGAARIQAPRSLWDPGYVETSWITQSLGNKPIALLPRVQSQIARNYPGTRLAITEYHYGGRNDASGLLSQADVLGVYGRYGVFAACIWGMSPRDRAQVAAFKAFLNSDGRGARFGDLGLTVQGETPALDSVYAARDSRDPNRLSVVALNKTDQPRAFALALVGFAPRRVSAAATDGADLDRPRALNAQARGGRVVFTAPPRSVVTLALTK